MRFAFILFISIFISLFVFSQSKLSGKGERLVQQADSLLKTDGDAAIQMAYRVLAQYGDNEILNMNTAAILAKAYRAKGNTDSMDFYANTCLQKAIKLQDTVSTIFFYTERGSDYYFKADYARALADYKKAESLYHIIATAAETEDISPLYFAKLLNNMGTAFIKTGHYDSSLRCFIHSIKIKESNHAAAATLIVSKINIGSIYLAIKDYDNSEIWLNQALKASIEEKDSVYMARCYANLGVLYKKTGDTNLAVENYKKGLAINESREDHRNEAIVLQNLALLLSSQQKYKEAHAYFIRALNNNNIIHANNSRLHLAMSRMFIEQQKYDSAIVHAQLSLSLARQSGNIHVQLEDYEILSKAYKGKRQYQRAFVFIEKNAALKDSVTSRENQQYIQSLKTKFETERKESEIIFLKELNKSERDKAVVIHSRQRLIILITILAFALLFVVASFYFLKKKKEKELYFIEKKLLETDLKNKELREKELQTEVDYKARQLTTHALNMLQRNKLLADILEKMKAISRPADDGLSMQLDAIVKDIGKSRKTEKDWELFKNYFENVNKGFNKKLRLLNPNLSTHDIRLAALVSLNLNIKETAALLNISPNSVKVARYRLRKRLNLENSEDLYAFLNKLKS